MNFRDSRTRSTLLVVAVSVLGAVLMPSCVNQPAIKPAAETHQINTDSGLVQGYHAENGTLAWFDIPYAAAPVGELRWKAPRPVAARTDLITKQSRPMACPQVPSMSAAGLEGESAVGNEDCLYLDIRAPETERQSLPVMVWIHGGGNTQGYKGAYDFSRLVNKENVIVVTINYRLGPLGWFTHPSVQAGAEGVDQSSNFGTLDIIASLQWVQANIAAFGGDPTNVTIFGESAGGHNVYALLASPLANGLFHKAIAQSGYVSAASPADAFNGAPVNPEIGRSSAALAVALGLSDSLASSAAISLAQWQTQSAADLITTWEALPDIGFEALTTADGIVIPTAGVLAGMRQRQSTQPMPVIAGANRDEVTLWLATSRYFVDVSYPLTRLGPPRLQLKNPDMYAFWVDIRSQAWKQRGIDDALAALAESGLDQLYAYRFSWDEQTSSWFADFPRLIGAAHGVEISFLTGDWYYGPLTNWIYPDVPSRDRLSATMMHAWAEFARDGKPASELAWTPWQPASRAFLDLDAPELATRLASASSLTELLAPVSESRLLNHEERCTLLWDSVVNIGQPDYALYREWDNGRCRTFDVKQYKRETRDALVAQFGSASVLD